jgi:hypothetical protein
LTDLSLLRSGAQEKYKEEKMKGRKMIFEGLVVLVVVAVVLAVWIGQAREGRTATPVPPTAASTVMATTMATAIPTSVQPDQPGRTLAFGEEWVVPAGWTCSGDIQVWSNGWVNLFDSDENTGLVVVFAKSAKIRAPWGAYCDPDDGAELMRIRLEAAGCAEGKGCHEVIIKTWK